MYKTIPIHSLDSAARRELEGGGGLGGAYESTQSQTKSCTEMERWKKF